MPWPKGRPRSADEKAKIGAAMRLRGGLKREIVIEDGIGKVPLGDGTYAVIDSEDVGRVDWRSWYHHTAGYAAAHEEWDGKIFTIYMHRLLCPVPPGMEVDHINGNRLDNRRRNLRPATDRQQRANQISRPVPPIEPDCECPFAVDWRAGLPLGNGPLGHVPGCRYWKAA